MRIVIVIMLLCRVAAGDTDTLTLEGQAMVSWIGPMAGGSLHYEHRVENNALTGRVAVATGEFLDDGQLELYSVFIGYRHYWWRHVFCEVEAGGFALRLNTDDFGERKRGVSWLAGLPDSQVTLGGKVGPVEVGLYSSLPFAGLGLQLGFDFAWW